jgi:hypothetical protein
MGLFSSSAAHSQLCFLKFLTELIELGGRGGLAHGQGDVLVRQVRLLRSISGKLSNQ